MLKRNTKILWITDKVDINHSIKGFVHNLIERTAIKVNHIDVLCLNEGEHHLPENVAVYPFGNTQIIKRNRMLKLCRFYWFAATLVRRNDVIFSHMSPYFTILAFPLALLWKKKIITWHAHKAVTIALRMATLMSSKILSSSPYAFSLPTKKVRFLGQCVDEDLYYLPEKLPYYSREEFHIVSVGRVDPIKDYVTLIKSVHILQKEKRIPKIRLTIMGGWEDATQEAYKRELDGLTEKLEIEHIVCFTGPKKPEYIRHIYSDATVAVNLCPTGAPDKAVFEAILAKVPVIVCNKAFAGILADEIYQPFFEHGNPNSLAEKLTHLWSQKQAVIESLTKNNTLKVLNNHTMGTYMDKLVFELSDGKMLSARL